MGTNECSQPASKSSWDSQDFGDISMVLKIANFRPPGHDELTILSMGKFWFAVPMSCNTIVTELKVSVAV